MEARLIFSRGLERVEVILNLRPQCEQVVGDPEAG
jgi:hypothetical protein